MPSVTLIVSVGVQDGDLAGAYSPAQYKHMQRARFVNFCHRHQSISYTMYIYLVAALIVSISDQGAADQAVVGRMQHAQ